MNIALDRKTSAEPSRPGKGKDLLIDTDVHEYLPSVTELLPYLDPVWRKHITDYGWKAITFPTDYPYAVPVAGRGGIRKDWVLDDGQANSVEVLQRQLFDGEGVTHAILNGFFYPSAIRGNYEFAAAMGRAYNDWQLEKWLKKDNRLRGSIHLAADDPAVAVKEIERLGNEPGFVQVFLPTSSDIEWGAPRYHVIYEAALAHGLAVGFHHSPISQSIFGWPRHFIQWHTVAHAQLASSQILSLIFNGVFDKLPQLKAVFLEPGIGWVHWLMRRADQQYRELRIDVPWVKRLPSEYIRENIRLSTQPISDLDPQQFTQIVEWTQSADMYMFSTDYPHYDADTGDNSVLNALNDDLRQRIRCRNAIATYPKLGIEP
jgi:uncharacterized protein